MRVWTSDLPTNPLLAKREAESVPSRPSLRAFPADRAKQGSIGAGADARRRMRAGGPARCSWVRLEVKPAARIQDGRGFRPFVEGEARGEPGFGSRLRAVDRMSVALS